MGAIDFELRKKLTEQAKEIWRQIGIGTKMACGARMPLADAKDGKPCLSFRVEIKRGSIYHISVVLEPSDTYTVALTSCRGGTVKELERREDVYCDHMSEVIYRMCNK